MLSASVPLTNNKKGLKIFWNALIVFLIFSNLIWSVISLIQWLWRRCRQNGRWKNSLYYSVLGSFKFVCHLYKCTVDAKSCAQLKHVIQVSFNCTSVPFNCALLRMQTLNWDAVVVPGPSSWESLGSIGRRAESSLSWEVATVWGLHLRSEKDLPSWTREHRWPLLLLFQSIRPPCLIKQWLILKIVHIHTFRYFARRLMLLSTRIVSFLSRLEMMSSHVCVSLPPCCTCSMSLFGVNVVWDIVSSCRMMSIRLPAAAVHASPESFSPAFGCCVDVPVRYTFTLAAAAYSCSTLFSVSPDHIQSCCSFQNRPAAVQGSPNNGQPPPCMSPALMNAPWVREGGGYTLFFSPSICSLSFHSSKYIHLHWYLSSLRCIKIFFPWCWLTSHNRNTLVIPISLAAPPSVLRAFSCNWQYFIVS